MAPNSLSAPAEQKAYLCCRSYGLVRVLQSSPESAGIELVMTVLLHATASPGLSFRMASNPSAPAEFMAYAFKQYYEVCSL